jgi:hypothetical protein
LPALVGLLPYFHATEDYEMKSFFNRLLMCVAAATVMLSVISSERVSAQNMITPTMVASPIAATSVPGDTYYCAKCGKYHTRSAPNASASPSVQQVGFQSAGVVSSTPASDSTASVPRASGLRGGAAVQNVLSALNGQRARQGIGSLRYDPALQAVAERRAQMMASMSLKSHPPGSYAPGTYEGVGWSSSYSPSGVSACFTSDSRMQAAGAAMATGRDGVYFAVVYR